MQKAREIKYHENFECSWLRRYTDAFLMQFDRGWFFVTLIKINIYYKRRIFKTYKVFFILERLCK